MVIMLKISLWPEYSLDLSQNEPLRCHGIIFCLRASIINNNNNNNNNHNNSNISNSKVRVSVEV